MNSITYEEFLKFKPCWLKTEKGAARLKKIGTQKERWTALDILALDDVSAENKLWAVLREELINVRTLHEFACWCAEDALNHVENPDERSWNAIKVKRAWLRGGRVTRNWLSHGMPQRLPRRLPHGIPHGMPQRLSHGMPQRLPHGMPHENGRQST